MRQELSSRTIALIALGLAVFASVFCWGWASRYCSTVEMYRNKLENIESAYANLETQLLNLGALLQRISEEPPRSRRLEPTHAIFPSSRDLGTSPTLETIERARANQFLVWYYLQLRRLHRSMVEGN